LIIALPVLSAIFAGLLAARLWAPLARFVERALPRRSVAGRIALLGSIRRPLRALATTAFLTGAVASVVFAGAYRSTLLDGSADQAAYAVPLDATLRSGPDALTPAAVVEPTALRAAVPGAQVYATLRTSGAVQSATGVTNGLQVLAVDPDALRHAHRWSRTTGSAASPASIAAQLPTPPGNASPMVPGTGHQVSVQVTGMSADIAVTLWLGDEAGRQRAVMLTHRGTELSGSLPALTTGPLHAVAVVVREQSDYATHHQHAIGEGNTDQPVPAGTLTFGQLHVDGAPMSWAWSGWGAANATVRIVAEWMVLNYRLDGSDVVVTPGFIPNAQMPPLPVVVDPDTAGLARDGLLPTKIAGQQTMARVVATLPRMPTVDGSFLVADRAAVLNLLNRTSPGSGTPTEMWIAAPANSQVALNQALHSAPYDRLTVLQRHAMQADLNADPVGRGSRVLLAIVGGLALAIAAASLVLLIVGERRDGAGELYAWESDGVRPSVLRRMLLIRTLTVVGVALPIGLVAGLVVARLGARLVAVDASGNTPQPPLQTTISSGWTALVLLAGLAAGVLCVWAVAARTLREPVPAHPEADLR
jgi:hypothetical protein